MLPWQITKISLNLSTKITKTKKGSKYKLKLCRKKNNLNSNMKKEN